MKTQWQYFCERCTVILGLPTKKRRYVTYANPMLACGIRIQMALLIEYLFICHLCISIISEENGGSVCVIK